MKKLFFVLSFLAFVPAVQAQMDCEEVPSCAELGYTQDSCAGGKGVRCPFDESKFYCSGVKQLPDAENPGVTDENWTAKCADKIAYCTAYNTECQCTACEDTYLISDGACVPECDKSADTCAAESKVFNAETCTCEACPTNYQFNSETKACEQIACDKTKVEHCATYDSEYEPCNCQTCETNYLLVDGVCKKMCTKVENCTTYDSEYDPCNCTACEDGYIFENGACVVDPCVEKCKIAYPLFAGQDNTNAAIDQIGSQALAADAAHRFYVGDKNGDFGQGKWYLPSIGEWMYFYGTDVTKMTAGRGTTGATGNTKTLINNALKALSSKGVNAEGLNERKSYWSSSEGNPSRDAWSFSTKQGYRIYNGKGFSNALRCSLFLKDCFNPATGGIPPKTGDVMYSDKTYGSVADYDGSKTPVGIVSSVSKNGRDVTIINLKDLTFGSSSLSDFDPDNPYGRSNNSANWAGHYDTSKNITGIQDFDADQLLSAAQASGNCPCQLYKEENSSCNLTAETCATQGKTFNNISCACEDCPSGYLFDNEVNECREACKEEWQCNEHDSLYNPCNCTECNIGGYLVIGGYSNSKGAFRCNLNAEYHCKVDYCLACDLTDSVCVACGGNRILKDNKCVLRENKCSHGTIIYDDFQCYKEDQVPSGRVPIGIVINSTNGYKNPGKLKILSLDSVELPWSENLSTTKTGCNSRTDGKANTDCIIAAGAEEDSAAVYCNNYGVMDDDKGKWFLPSIQEVLILGPVNPDYFEEVEEDRKFLITALNTALNSLGNSTVYRSTDYDRLLSSTEYSDTQAIYSYLTSPREVDPLSWHRSASKTKKMRVQCVREFEDAPTIEHCDNYTRYGCRYCDSGYMPSEDRASCIQASCSKIEDCEKYDPTTCHCALCSPRTGSYLSSDGFTCFRPIPYCKDQKEGVCQACKSGYALSDDKLSCIAQ